MVLKFFFFLKGRSKLFQIEVKELPFTGESRACLGSIQSVSVLILNVGHGYLKATATFSTSPRW